MRTFYKFKILYNVCLYIIMGLQEFPVILAHLNNFFLKIYVYNAPIPEWYPRCIEDLMRR